MASESIVQFGLPPQGLLAQWDGDKGTGTWGRGHGDTCVGTWDLGTRDEGLEDIKYGTRGLQTQGRRGGGDDNDY